jgi:hypothetical protein
VLIRAGTVPLLLKILKIIMKKVFAILSIALLFASCAGPTEKPADAAGEEKLTGAFGAEINETGAIPVSQLIADMGDKQEMNAKVEGKIIECCKKKGCWMDIDKGDGTPMKVTFKDYAFFVPKNADGKTAVFEGRAYVDTISVETLRHYAEDAGKSKEEIEKITEPKTEVAFEADGVIIK